MVGTTENVEIHGVILRVRVYRKMGLGEYKYTSDTERLKLVERPADDSQFALVCNLIHQGLNIVNVVELNTRYTSDEVLHFLVLKMSGFFYTMNEFSIIDGELAILRDGEVEYVFERDSFSKAAYDYMINWIQGKKSPEDDPGTAWLEAEKSWDALSPETQAMLMTIANKERQQALDIRDGLLATLHGYHGVKSIKDAYTDCIRACFNLLN